MSICDIKEFTLILGSFRVIGDKLESRSRALVSAASVGCITVRKKKCDARGDLDTLGNVKISACIGGDENNVAAYRTSYSVFDSTVIALCIGERG